jgi:hypothetical protein
LAEKKKPNLDKQNPQNPRNPNQTENNTRRPFTEKKEKPTYNETRKKENRTICRRN